MKRWARYGLALVVLAAVGVTGFILGNNFGAPEQPTTQLTLRTPRTFLGLDALEWSATLTALLIAVTITYVITTGRLAKHAGRTATTAQRDLLLRAMPQVIPTGEVGGGSRSQGQRQYILHLINAGHSVAVNVEWILHLTGRGVDEGVGWSGQWAHAIPPASEVEVKTSRPEATTPWPVNQYRITVEYDDLIGNKYRATKDGVAGGGSSVVLERSLDKGLTWDRVEWTEGA